MIKKFLLITFAFIFCCSAEEAALLSFQDLVPLSELLEHPKLADLNGKHVQIRGFLYKTEDQTLILASQPNLQSCCIGSQAKIEQQVVVNGPIVPQPHVMTIKGIFAINPQYDAKGNLIHLYFLKNSEAMASTTGSIPWGMILGISVLITVLYFKLRFFKKLSSPRDEDVSKK